MFVHLVVVFGFDKDTYEVREDAGPPVVGVSFKSGNLGFFTVILNTATDDSFINATATGDHRPKCYT